MGTFFQYEKFNTNPQQPEPEMAGPVEGPPEGYPGDMMEALRGDPAQRRPFDQTTANAVARGADPNQINKGLAAVMGGIMPSPYKAYQGRPAGAFGSSVFGGPWDKQGGQQSQVDAYNARQKMRETQIMLMLNGMGTSQRNRIVSEGRRQTAAATQGALNRGMGASSILGSIQRAGQTATSDRLSALSDMLTGRKVSFLNSITEDRPPVGQFLQNAERLAYYKGLAAGGGGRGAGATAGATAGAGTSGEGGFANWTPKDSVPYTNGADYQKTMAELYGTEIG